MIRNHLPISLGLLAGILLAGASSAFAVVPEARESVSSTSLTVGEPVTLTWRLSWEEGEQPLIFDPPSGMGGTGLEFTSLEVNTAKTREGDRILSERTYILTLKATAAADGMIDPVFLTWKEGPEGEEQRLETRSHAVEIAPEPPGLIGRVRGLPIMVWITLGATLLGGLIAWAVARVRRRRQREEQARRDTASETATWGERLERLDGLAKVGDHGAYYEALLPLAREALGRLSGERVVPNHYLSLQRFVEGIDGLHQSEIKQWAAIFENAQTWRYSGTAPEETDRRVLHQFVIKRLREAGPANQEGMR